MQYKGFDLSGKVALVTGGSKGLGKAMARGLAEAGADVLISSRHEDELRAALDDILAGTGRRGRFVVACTTAGVGPWRARSLAVCPATFNYLVENAGNKSAILSYGFIRLLSDAVEAATSGRGGTAAPQSYHVGTRWHASHPIADFTYSANSHFYPEHRVQWIGSRATACQTSKRVSKKARLRRLA